MLPCHDSYPFRRPSRPPTGKDIDHGCPVSDRGGGTDSASNLRVRSVRANRGCERKSRQVDPFFGARRRTSKFLRRRKQPVEYTPRVVIKRDIERLWPAVDCCELL